MKDAEEDGRETLLNRVKVFERQLAVIELPIYEYVLYNPLDKRFDPLRSGLLQVARGRLHRIGQHQYTRFSTLRFWSHVSEVYVLDCINLRLFLLLRPGVKMVHQRGSVMLFDHFLDLPAKPVSRGKLNPFFHVGEDDECAHVW